MLIPTNFSIRKKEFDEKLEKLKFSKKIHIDFMDGVFTEKKSTKFSNMEKLKDYKYDSEIHLMAHNPLKYLQDVVELNFKKVLIHIEVFNTNMLLQKTIKSFKENNIKVFLVIDSNTNINVLFNFLKDVNIKKNIDGVMFMGVKCGKEGQKFLQKTFLKVEKFKNFYPKIKVQIDGGVNDLNIKKIKKVFDIISIGSFVSSSSNPKKSFLNLRNL